MSSESPDGELVFRLDRDRRRKGSRTSRRGARIRTPNRLCLERVVPKFLRARESVERWRTKGMGCTEPLLGSEVRGSLLSIVGVVNTGYIYM